MKESHEEIRNENVLEYIALAFSSPYKEQIIGREPIIATFRYCLYENEDGSPKQYNFSCKEGFPDILRTIFDELFEGVPHMDGYPGMYNCCDWDKDGKKRHKSNMLEVGFNNKHLLAVRP